MGSTGVSPSETFTIFVDQILVVLRLAIDRIDPVEQDLQLDIGDLVSLLVQYLSRLGREESELRSKVKFCQLMESILSKNACISLSSEESLKNTILDQLVDWSVEAQRVSTRNASDSSSGWRFETFHRRGCQIMSRSRSCDITGDGFCDRESDITSRRRGGRFYHGCCENEALSSLLYSPDPNPGALSLIC